MAKPITLAAALVLALVLAGSFVGVLGAQEETTRSQKARIFSSCSPDKDRISAAKLPRSPQDPSGTRTVGLGRCPINGRPIVDAGGVGTVLPSPGEGMHAEIYSPEDSQELSVTNNGDGTVVLSQVGDDTARSGEQEKALESRVASRAASNGCGDSAHNPNPANTGRRLYRDIRYYFNARSTPSNVSKVRARDAIVAGSAGIAQVRNPCGVRDRVPRKMVYSGPTSTSVDISSNNICLSMDRMSVIGFGDLPANSTATECQRYTVRDGQDEVLQSDVRLNKADYGWTARVTRSCVGRYDIQSTVTHERGHSFGMNHVDEGAHGGQTMSPISEGPCQMSERSLGRGDARGLNQKYP